MQDEFEIKPLLEPELTERQSGQLEPVPQEDFTSAPVTASASGDALQVAEDEPDLGLQLMHALDEGLVITGLDSKINSVNPACEHLLGYTSQELIGKSLFNLVVAGEYQAARDGLALSKADQINRFEIHLLRKDGTNFPARISRTPYHRQGEKQGFMVFVSDLSSEHNQVEAALRQSEQNYRLLASHFPNSAVFLYDLDLRYLVVGGEALERAGFSVAKMEGRTLYDALPPGMAEKLEPRYRAALRGETIKEELRNPISGEIFATTFQPVKNEQGEIIAGIIVAYDITELRQAEEALRLSETELRQAQKMEAVGRLAGGIAHDFNNLLTGIMGYAELASLGAKDNPQLHNYIQEMKTGCTRAAELIHQLLAFSRKQVLQPEIVNLNEVVIRIHNLLRRIIGEDIEFITQLDRELQPVEVDPTQIEQVIINLAINARDAMSEGGGRLTIETHNVALDETQVATLQLDATTFVAGDYVMLSVSDSGCGFSAEAQQHIFEPFFTTKSMGKGPGLGLSTVYGIVRQSKGHIWFTSQAGVGTTFRIYLPVRVVSPFIQSQIQRPVLTSDVGTPLEVAPNADTTGTSKETLLLVEDDEVVRSVTRELLEMEGFEIIESENGPAALRLLGDNQATATATANIKLKLVISDVRMPGMSGPVLVENLRHLYPDLKVLFISGYTASEIELHTRLGPGVEFLQKPFTMKQLLDKVRAMLENAN